MEAASYVPFQRRPADISRGIFRGRQTMQQFRLSSHLKRGALGTFPLLLRSFSRHGVTQRRVTVDVVSEDPLIWVVDGLCEQRQVQQLKDVLSRQKLDNLKKTDAYVDDMFDERRELQEDAQMLVSMISSGALQTVPAEYQEDPLRSLLWTAMQRPELLQSSDWDLALLSTARRAWCTQWNPDDLARSGFRKSAFRCRVPEELLPQLAPLVLDVLGAPVQGLPGTGSKDQRGPCWVLRDTTVVRYQPDESQVPHVDTSDVTMLLYLSDSGGHTCFPNLGCSIQPREGRVLVFCSTKPTQRRFGGFAGSAYGEPLDATMHYGSLMQDSSHDEKLIVQLLFAAEDANLSLQSWREALHGVKLRDAEKTQNLQAQPMRSLPRAQRRPSLALDQMKRCASGCRALALDLTVPGTTKVCIHCWQRRLEQQKP